MHSAQDADMSDNSFDDDFSFPKEAPRPSQGSEIFEPTPDRAHGWHDRGNDPNGFDAIFPDANPAQQIVQDRRSVKRQFAFTTPPDDARSKLGHSKSPSGQFAVTEAVKRARSDKSERARNAANQRHAKTRKMRKVSQESISVIGENAEDEAGNTKEKYREKNRVAAAKCRANKKENIEDIKAKHSKLSAVNSSLKKQIQELRGQLTDLRMHALNHQDCNCQISRYNINQAKKVVTEMEVPSLSTGFQDSPDPVRYLPSPLGMGDQISRTNSLGFSNFTFASLTTPEDMGSFQSQDISPHLGDYTRFSS